MFRRKKAALRPAAATSRPAATGPQGGAKLQRHIEDRLRRTPVPYDLWGQQQRPVEKAMLKHYLETKLSVKIERTGPDEACVTLDGVDPWVVLAYKKAFAFIPIPAVCFVRFRSTPLGYTGHAFLRQLLEYHVGICIQSPAVYRRLTAASPAVHWSKLNQVTATADNALILELDAKFDDLPPSKGGAALAAASLSRDGEYAPAEVASQAEIERSVRVYTLVKQSMGLDDTWADASPATAGSVMERTDSPPATPEQEASPATAGSAMEWTDAPPATAKQTQRESASPAAATAMEDIAPAPPAVAGLITPLPPPLPPTPRPKWMEFESKELPGPAARFDPSYVTMDQEKSSDVLMIAEDEAGADLLRRVYASDLQPYTAVKDTPQDSKAGGQQQESVAGYRVFAPNTCLAALKKGQHVQATLYATLGRWCEDARFKPAHVTMHLHVAVGFAPSMPVLAPLAPAHSAQATAQTGETLELLPPPEEEEEEAYTGPLESRWVAPDATAARNFAALCPANVFDVEDLGGPAATVFAARPEACTYCDRCVVLSQAQKVPVVLRPKRTRHHVRIQRAKANPVHLAEAALNYLHGLSGDLYPAEW